MKNDMQNKTEAGSKKPAQWSPPSGWFQAAHDARDAEALFQALIDDNACRAARGLPTFEPSYELALAAVRA